MAGVAGGVSAGPLVAGGVPAQQIGQLPANTTLLQTGSNYFRLSDALTALDSSSDITALQQAITDITNTVNTLSGQLAGIQATLTNHAGRIAALEGRVTTIEQRLAAALIP